MYAAPGISPSRVFSGREVGSRSCEWLNSGTEKGGCDKSLMLPCRGLGLFWKWNQKGCDLTASSSLILSALFAFMSLFASSIFSVSARSFNLRALASSSSASIAAWVFVR